ncbi:PEP-CTERM sorting domain-containing protein [Thalassotalea mangrovi]|uniref:PEP-CTERM sorting domain-containing protein n=1 Tax=Thalassotalea mangrovi TaxID=2572245 RepID=A0A4U1B320_9GAMM|nr:PEP-CTERM sorting domain-containing protein [Thalassotalea mangrovi]TKB44205.1 PEP-CTERM sorting domain-containing protein [Thalassotalea mangrovi]
MKHLKQLCLTACFLVFSSFSFAAVIPGQSDYIENEDGSVTFIFDLVSADIEGEGMGLSFSYFGLELIATSQAIVIQDFPANGGLGVDSNSDGDNLASGDVLILSFNEFVTITAMSFNGLMGQDGHQEMADGLVLVGGNILDTADYSMVGSALDMPMAGTAFTIAGATNQFTGYLESVTLFIGEPPQGIPEPGTLLLFAGAIFGLFGIRRFHQRGR